MKSLKDTVISALSTRKLIAILAENVNLDKDKVEIIDTGNNTYKILINCSAAARKKILL